MKPITDRAQLNRLVINGYKSIAECSLELGALNVLIGCNGAGKSNFIGFFRLIQQMLESNLQAYVSKQGGPDSILHFGRKVTEKLHTELYFGNNGFIADFEATKDNRLMIAEESFYWNVSGPRLIGRGEFESLAMKGTRSGIDRFVVPAMKQWRVYHFHDTSDSASVKQIHQLNDNEYFREDAKNLAAFLFRLKEEYPNEFEHIEKTVRLVAPFFGKFNLRATTANKNAIQLEWFEYGQDVPFKAYQLSDGTLRFICLAVVFLQPSALQPETIFVDEPELGLHPYAITTLASMIRSVSKSKQVIISTQSVELLNEFDPQDVVVIDRKDGKHTAYCATPEVLRAGVEKAFEVR